MLNNRYSAKDFPLSLKDGCFYFVFSLNLQTTI